MKPDHAKIARMKPLERLPWLIKDMWPSIAILASLAFIAWITWITSN